MFKLSARVSVLLSMLAGTAVCAGGSQHAYADCTGASPNFECSGSSGAQSIKADNADVTTAPGFNVSATNKDALAISGDGQISYTDKNAASLSSTSRAALNVVSTGNDGATDGSVTIDISGPLNGGTTRLSATNYGTGATAIKSGGTVEGQKGYGIFAANKNTAAMDLTIDASDTVTASGTAVSAVNDGTGVLSIDVPDVSGATGITATNKGLGALTINSAAAVEGKSGNGILRRPEGRRTCFPQTVFEQRCWTA